MRVLIKELFSEWRHVWTNPFNRYSLRTKKYILRRYITIVNKELSFLTRQIITSPLTLLIILSSVGVAFGIISTINIIDVTQLLKIVEGFIVSFISVLVAAAIFISTLHRQSSNKTVEIETSLSSMLARHRTTMRRVFNKYKSKMTLEEKISLFKAAPCDSVIDPTDYGSFKKWHLANRSFLDNLSLSHNNYLKQPFDCATSVNWNRAGFLVEGCKTAQEVMKREGGSSAMKLSVGELLVACQQYLASNGHAFRYYIPVEFVGKRLYRVVVYSLFSMGLTLVAITFPNYHNDLFPYTNFHIVDNLVILAMVATFLSIYLILRYVFMFITYLRDSTARHPYAINSVYIYEPDENMHHRSPLG